MPLTQIMHVYHLLKAANTEVESNFLNSIIEFESSQCGYWLVNNDVCCLGQLRSVGASVLNPYKTLVKDFCRVFHSFPHMMVSMMVNKHRETPFVRDTDRHHSHSSNTQDSI